ncbi:MAG: TGS domain-containing protein [Candidatus Gracilibacteria bacterium]|jgi:GTP pyrophosphokinase
MIKKIINKLKAFNIQLDSKKIELLSSFVNSADKNEFAEKNVIDVLSYIIPITSDESIILAIILYYIGGKNVDFDKVLNDFGKEVHDILGSVMKLEALSYKQDEKELQMEIFRKMLLAVAKDIRVVLIVLVNRLNKMKNLNGIKSDEDFVRNFANETMEIYVPVAARLGMYRIKSDLEDEFLKYTSPNEYNRTERQIKKFIKEKQKAVVEIQDKIDLFLRGRGYFSQVKGRIKSIYSTYNKLKRKNFSSIEDLYDVFAIRITVPAQYDENGNELVDHLYSILGLIHSEWRPLSRRFKDFIAVPKPNGYRSLHTVVLGLAPEYIDKPVEIQIRSEDMDKEAEYGVSSHWMYKQYTSPEDSVSGVKLHADWLKGLQRVNEEFRKGTDLSEIGIDIFKDRIFVLTPKGEVKDLTAGSTPIDFAYAVHTEIGNKCIMAKVNGSIVPLDHTLSNGDVVEVVTRRDATPKLQWLSIAKTGFARNKIKAYFSSLNKDSNVKEGKRLINAYLERLSKPKLDQSYSILKNYGRKNLGLAQREQILEEVGKGYKLVADVIRKIFPYEEMIIVDEKKEAKKDQRSVKNILNPKDETPLGKYVLIGGESGMSVKMAPCCKPKYGDKIIAYMSRGTSATVHKISCTMIDGLDKKRFVMADWKRTEGVGEERKYRAAIKLTVVSRVGLIRDITAVISGMNIMIIDMKMEGKGWENNRHDDLFTLEFNDPKKFDTMLDKLENIDGVEKVVKV